MCYGDPSATEVPPCCETATKKLTFSTTSVLLLLNMPLSLSRATIFRRQKNPRRVYRPKIAGILFVYNEPEGKYYTVPICYEPRQHCLLRPCGHRICTTCVARLIVCPMCRATIESTDPHVARDTYCLRNAARRFQEEQDMHELREAAAHRVPTRPYSGRSDGELSMNRGRRGRHRRTRRRALRRHRRRRRRQHHRRRQHRHHRGRAPA